MSTSPFNSSRTPLRNLQHLLSSLVFSVSKVFNTFEICAAQVLFNHNERIDTIETGRLKVSPRAAAAVISTEGNAVYSAANFATGVIERDPNGSNRADTTDSAVNLIAGLGLTADYQSIDCLLVNKSSDRSVGLSGGTGVTQQYDINFRALHAIRISIVRTSATNVSIRSF